MREESVNNYSVEFKEQILKECIETSNYSIVCRKYNILGTTVCGWIKKYKNRDNIKRKTL